MNIEKQNKALFIDRDGTINIEKNYVYKIEDFEFTPGIFNLLLKFQQLQYIIIIITNQSGIARGFYSEADYLKLTNWMIHQFKINGIQISKVCHCPHHPKISGSCNCRKPKPGLLFKAMDEFNINPGDSILIGDKKSDILAGENAGIGRNYFIQDILAEGEIKFDLP